MSHVIDRNAVKQVDINVPCDCPIPVHWVRLSEHYSYMDKMGLTDAASRGAESVSRFRFMKRLKDWNLVDEKGRKLPITHAMLGELSEGTATRIWDAIDKLDDADEDGDDLPNASSAS